MSSRLRLLPVLLAGSALLAAAALAQTAAGGQAGSAAADSAGAALADTSMVSLEQRYLAIEERLAAFGDSLIAEGYSPRLVEVEIQRRRERLQREVEVQDREERGLAEPLFFDCSNTPEAGVKADVTKVNYYGKWSNSVKARDNGNVGTNFGISYDSYRRQDKTVEARNASVDYGSGQLLPVVLSAQARIDWSEDITTNTGGLTNVNKRKSRRAGLGVTRNDILTGPVQHDFTAGAYYNDQNAVNQQQSNDFKEGELNGALRSGLPVAEGLNLATRIYGIWRDGESTLADFESPSSTTGDTLGAGAYYKRRLLEGAVTATQSSFDRRYLDYRRNSNGLIDTTNVPPGASKVIRELEEKDATELSWDNTLRLGSFSLASTLKHTFDRQQYRESAVGRKDRNDDLVTLRLAVPAGADSFNVSYKYNLKWDDQRIKDAESDRGRQNSKVREFIVDWFRDLFSNTSISARYRTELSQDIAEVKDGEPFNENDRDRLTQNARVKLDAGWTSFSVSLLGEYQQVDDISIRATRSANNNVKRTYEVAPSYRWTVSPKVSLNQTFRMYIQYQDYDFVGFPGVNKEDGFNKRGNLNTSLSWEPSDRLSLDLSHDYNQKFNGTRTDTDASGTSLYRRDQDQFINRIELGLAWEAAEWLRLSSATYRTKDVVKRFGTTESEDTRYSGELWIGAVVKHSWGPKDRPLKIDASVRRYLAYGPNVTDTSDDYWRADVLMSWTF